MWDDGPGGGPQFDSFKWNGTPRPREATARRSILETSRQGRLTEEDLGLTGKRTKGKGIE